LGYIFETELITHLIQTFLSLPMFRNVTLKCLTEIVSIHADAYQEKFIVLFNLTMGRLKQVRIIKQVLRNFKYFLFLKIIKKLF
jgi:hypothetical protein